MEMLVLDDRVAENLIAERERLGLDRFDEVHAGRYVINASPNSFHGYLVTETAFVLRSLCTADEGTVDSINVGPPDDYRITDVAVVRRDTLGTDWHTDGACVVAVEILSPGERPGVRSQHYAGHGVTLYLEVDPAARTVVAVEHGGWHHSADDVVRSLTAALFSAA